MQFAVRRHWKLIVLLVLTSVLALGIALSIWLAFSVWMSDPAVYREIRVGMTMVEVDQIRSKENSISGPSGYRTRTIDNRELNYHLIEDSWECLAWTMKTSTLLPAVHIRVNFDRSGRVINKHIYHPSMAEIWDYWMWRWEKGI